MSNNKLFLQVNDLRVDYVTRAQTVHAVNGVSFTLEKGKTLGLVGETGAGKTTIARAIMRVLQTPPAVLKSGEVILDGKRLLELSEEEMCGIRGSWVTMIFQDPMTSLNPVMSIGSQIAEVIEQHVSTNKAQVRTRACEMLELVGIPKERYDEFPHQFSGGMKQRVVIAIALACHPDLLLADEPTTALDVTIQAQVLELMRNLRKETHTSTILITHDLGVVAEMCDEVAIVYAGEIVEIGSREDLFDHPTHPYTIGLFGAIPQLDSDVEWLSPVEGMPPDPTNLPTGCKFHPRCPYATDECRVNDVELRELSPKHLCRCIHLQKEGQA